jgi:hypothetical protein
MKSLFVEITENDPKIQLLLLKKKLRSSKPLSRKDMIFLCDLIGRLIDESEKFKEEISDIKGRLHYDRSNLGDIRNCDI